MGLGEENIRLDERRRTGRVHKKSFERWNLVCDSKVDEKLLIELQELSGEDQSRQLSRLVDKGLAETKMDIAVDFIKDKVSLAKSASIAGV